MKMVVIGGTGLIGSKLVERLRRDGHELVAALEGAQVVVDVSNAPPRSLLTAESAAHVGHHVMLSVVGAVAQEEAVKAGPVPYTILRATQLFETVAPPSALIQPVAADDVVGALADIAVGSPLNDTVELAGPEAFRLDERGRRVPQTSSDDRSLIPGDDARIAPTRFEDWLSRSARTRSVTTHNREDLPCSPPSFSSTALSPSPRAGTASSIG